MDSKYMVMCVYIHILHMRKRIHYGVRMTTATNDTLDKHLFTWNVMQGISSTLKS